MQAIITPTKGAAPYIVPLRAPPTFAAQVIGGYSQATLIQGRVASAIADRLLYGDVVVYGKRGPCWRGIVESSERSGTLHCVGPQQVLGWTVLASAPGSSTSLSAHMSILQGSPGTYLPVWLYPAPSENVYVQTNTRTLASSLTPPGTNYVAYIGEVLKYDTWQYGWYFERISGADVCVPHYSPQPTAPDYIVTLSAEDAVKFMGDSLAPLFDRVAVPYSGGLATWIDTDPAHYLVGLGRAKTVSVSAASGIALADAQQVSDVKFAEMGAGTKAGRISFGGAGESRVQRASGLVAYPPSVRPGSLARIVGLRGGPQDMRITATECQGDSSGTLELGVDAGRLDALLARVG